MQLCCDVDIPDSMQQFDYESMTSYSLVIQAINTAFPRHEAVVNVTVTVRDTNDNTPRFSMPGGYVRSVSESATVGTPVGTVVATDSDGGLNGTVSIPAVKHRLGLFGCSCKRIPLRAMTLRGL